MILLDKWDYKTKEYLPFISPANHLIYYTENMDDNTDCANCGTHTTFGKCFTSKQIHSHSGLGFPVCGSCHDLEMALYRENEL